MRAKLLEERQRTKSIINMKLNELRKYTLEIFFHRIYIYTFCFDHLLLAKKALKVSGYLVHKTHNFCLFANFELIQNLSP